MRDAEGRARLPFKPRRKGPDYVRVHCSVDPATYEKLVAYDVATERRSLSATVGALLRDILSDDALTAEEGRLIQRGLNALMAEESMDEETMGQVETLTEKIQRVWPEMGVR